ncbi:glycosyltransferase 87 family protein [Corynebacterium heidelbergense]|uniref:DUF2029 domain-containing protein n=1 Tax=Corynebacterium heidelbergense TaxID=2055947 RepID=A0A364VDB7_9CORY|nr:glycosyltransferase 87 family protein [Corynebacterium heidelbergense]RAV34556.1 hypothetical protein CWC39_02530 [Corynebacterium heidelbergense]
MTSPADRALQPAPKPARRSPWLLAVGSIGAWAIWLAALWVLFYFVTHYRTATGDVHYYYWGTRNPHSRGAPLTEYPHAGTWPLNLVFDMEPTDPFKFVQAFATSCWVLSGLFMLYLWVSGLRRGGSLRGAWVWALFCSCAGPILVARLDLVPGLLVAFTFALVGSHPRIASALLAFATASKLWPGVLAAALVGKWNARRTYARLIWFALSVAGLCWITISTSGVDRLFSPLNYQDGRGLQIESVAATPYLIAAWMHPGQWRIKYMPSKSFEILGPNLDWAITATNIVMIATLVLALAAAAYHFFRGAWNDRTSMSLALAVVCLLIVSNKVFSPQYMVWIAPLVCVMCVRRKATVPALYAVLLILVTAATLVVYPVTYEGLIGPSLKGLPVVMLAIRNSGMLILTIWAIILWVLSVRRAHAQDKAVHEVGDSTPGVSTPGQGTGRDSDASVRDERAADGPLAEGGAKDATKQATTAEPAGSDGAAGEASTPPGTTLVQEKS